MGSPQRQSNGNVPGGGFVLNLRHDGRINKSHKPSYVGGQTTSFSNIDVNEWGLFTLRDKVKCLGYEIIDSMKMFVNQSNGLIEIVSDCEVWDLVKEIEVHNEIEIWVVHEGDVDGAEDVEDAEGVEDADPESEAEWESEEDAESDESSVDLDDIEFEQFVDPTAEFGGLDDAGTALGVQVNEDLEIKFSDEGSEKDSDNEEAKEYQLPMFKGKIEMATPTFCLGLTFGSKAEFKEAIYNYAMNKGKEILYIKNDKVRCIVECNETECPFRITLRKQASENDWRITAINDKHDGCCWNNINYMANSTTIAKRWKNEVASNSNWTASEFLKKVSTTDGISISRRQAWRAMRKARAAIYGEEEKCFNKLWSYCLEIDRTNPGSKYHVKLGDKLDDGNRRFKRFYMCWEACRIGYKYCRPIIGVDGCHLKGLHGGQLLLAIGVDGNDSVFPLAYAHVEGENKESWIWFLKHLKSDLAITPADELELTFISDKQKGLLPAFEEVLPAVTHRFCVRHLHGNMKLAGFTGKAIKDGLWDAARATTINTFTAAMKKMKTIDSKAYEWLVEKHPSEWSRSHFNTNAHCDILVNNICECYNSVILDAREKPLISCLETLRKKIMHRLYQCRKAAWKWTGPICPRIMKKIAQYEKQANGYTVIQSDDNLFETRGVIYSEFEQHEVDLGRMTCTCRSWDLTGIPCRHAISAIWMKHGKGPVNDYVHQCYFTQTYLKAYGGSIKPMAGPTEWPETDRKPHLPPVYTAKPGRPKKARKKGMDEISTSGKKKGVAEVSKSGKKKAGDEVSKDGIHLKRSHVKMHCTKCKKEGHNKRKCPEDPAVRERLANPKKRVRAKANKPTNSQATESETAQETKKMVVPTLPDATLEDEDDNWLANIDIDAVVSQVLQNQTMQPQVDAEEIPITSQPPTVGEEEDSQQVTPPTKKKLQANATQWRKYNTRGKMKSKFKNTSDDPISID